jgi:hypothetical protein
MNVKRFKSFGDLTKGYFKVLFGNIVYRTRADGYHSFRILETPGKLYLVIVSQGETCVMLQGVVTKKRRISTLLALLSTDVEH